MLAIILQRDLTNLSFNLKQYGLAQIFFQLLSRAEYIFFSKTTHPPPQKQKCSTPYPKIKLVLSTITVKIII